MTDTDTGTTDTGTTDTGTTDTGTTDTVTRARNVAVTSTHADVDIYSWVTSKGKARQAESLSGLVAQATKDDALLGIALSKFPAQVLAGNYRPFLRAVRECLTARQASALADAVVRASARKIDGQTFLPVSQWDCLSDKVALSAYIIWCKAPTEVVKGEIRPTKLGPKARWIPAIAGILKT